jgi:hypothetical protein
MNCYSTSEQYKTALGEMDCIVYYYQFFPRPGNYEYYYYLKKNVGYVGYVVKFRGVVIKKRILRSYELFTTPQKRSCKKVNKITKNKIYLINKLMR